MKNKNHPFKEFSSNIKEKNISNLLVLGGEEDYLVNWARDEIKSTYVSKGLEAMDYHIIEDEFNISAIIESIETLPFMSEKRVVVIRDFPYIMGNNKKKLAREDEESLLTSLNNIDDKVVVIFTTNNLDQEKNLSKFIEEKGHIYLFDRLKGTDLSKFVLKKIMSYQCEISNENLNYLIKLSPYTMRERDYNLYDLEADILKLACYSEGSITREDIDSIIVPEEDKFVYSLMDAILDKRKGKALLMLKNILGSGDIYSLLQTLISQWELLLSTKELSSDGIPLSQQVKILSVNSFRLEKASYYSRKFSREDIANSLVRLYEVDKNTKNGNLSGDIALELFIGKI